MEYAFHIDIFKRFHIDLFKRPKTLGRSIMQPDMNIEQIDLKIITLE